jgi:signal transduction histidine kinase
MDDLRQAKSRLIEEVTRLRHEQDSAKAEECLRGREMSAAIAHDINNCLSPIIGLSELMLSRPHLLEQPEKVLQYMRAINKAGQEAALVLQRLREHYPGPDDGDRGAVA